MSELTKNASNILGFILSTILVKNSGQIHNFSVTYWKKQLVEDLNDMLCNDVEGLCEVFEEFEVPEDDIPQKLLDLLLWMQHEDSHPELMKYVAIVVNDHIQDGY